MNTRSSRQQVRFEHPFTLPGHPEILPAGHYEVFVEEERLEGLSFDAYRRTSTHILIALKAGVEEMWPISEADLEAALLRDQQKS